MDFLDQIDSLAQSLGDAARWNHSGSPFAAVITDFGKDAQSDYAYELDCIATILDLIARQGFKILMTTIDVAGNPEYKLPKKPALKVKYSRFEVYDPHSDRQLVQICCGTKIEGKAGIKRAPDISFQKANSPDEPKANDVLFIHDTKFVEGGDCSKRISSNQFSFAAIMIQDLSLDRPVETIPDFGLTPDLCANCILTNGLASHDNGPYFREYFIRCVTCFPPLNEAKIVG